jgi:hypothetical protein
MVEQNVVSSQYQIISSNVHGEANVVSVRNSLWSLTPSCVHPPKFLLSLQQSVSSSVSLSGVGHSPSEILDISSSIQEQNRHSSVCSSGGRQRHQPRRQASSTPKKGENGRQKKEGAEFHRNEWQVAEGGQPPSLCTLH